MKQKEQFLHVNLDLLYILQGFDYEREEPRPSWLRMGGGVFLIFLIFLILLMFLIIFQHKIIEIPLIL